MTAALIYGIASINVLLCLWSQELAKRGHPPTGYMTFLLSWLAVVALVSFEAAR